MRVVDLSLPIVDHFRWSRALTRVQEHGDGIFQTSSIELLCHAFTHADAPSHIRPAGPPLGEMGIDTWVGNAKIIDLTDCGPGAVITSVLLDERGTHVQTGDIVLMKTCWDMRRDVASPSYWQDSPYVERSGADWLAARETRCVGFDFPQDAGIARLVAGQDATSQHFPTHEVLLARGIGLLEYLAGLNALERDHTFIVAAPLRVPDSDGAPVRALALEED